MGLFSVEFVLSFVLAAYSCISPSACVWQGEEDTSMFARRCKLATLLKLVQGRQ